MLGIFGGTVFGSTNYPHSVPSPVAAGPEAARALALTRDQLEQSPILVFYEIELPQPDGTVDYLRVVDTVDPDRSAIGSS